MKHGHKLLFIALIAVAAGLVLAGCASGGTAAGGGKNSRAVVSTLAGSGEQGSADGPGAAAKFDRPHGVALDSAGNVYVVDMDNNRIRKISLQGAVTTFAGSTAGYADGTGTAAQFLEPSGVAVDGAGNVYVTDNGNACIRKITPAGVVTTLAGSPPRGYANGTGAAAKFFWPNDAAVDGAGSVYVADSGNNRIRKISPEGAVTTFAGSAWGNADGAGTAAQFAGPQDVAIDSAGNLYVADPDNHRIRKITPEGVVSTLAGGGDTGRDKGGYADGTGTEARFNFPRGVAVDGAGNVYVADTRNHRIRTISPEGVVTTLAGSGKPGFADGRGTAAQFNEPLRVALDRAGNLYVADHNNNRIRKITITAP